MYCTEQKRYLLIFVSLLLCAIFFIILSGQVLTNPFAEFFSQSIDSIIGKMTLEEKIGQLFMFGIAGKTLYENTADLIRSGSIGNIKIFLRNVDDAVQLKKLNEAILFQTMESRMKIPPFIATDQEGGTVNHIRAENYFLTPSAALIGASRNVSLAYDSAALIAMQLKYVGINMNFAPVLDVFSNKANRVVGSRSFSSDPEQVIRYASAYLEAHEKLGIISVAKHFPGHGMTSVDSHLNIQYIDLPQAELEKYHLLPYRKLIKEKKIDCLMTAHVVYDEFDNANPATFSKILITDFLRNELQYKGLVITDDLEMEGASKASSDILNAFAKAFNAGNDLLMVAHTSDVQEYLIANCSYLFTNGTLSITDLDEKVKRILFYKKKYLHQYYKDYVSLDSDWDSEAYKSAYNEKCAALYKQIEKKAAQGITRIDTGSLSIGAIVEKMLAKTEKGLILSPTEYFKDIATDYLPSWETINVGFFPDKDKNQQKINNTAEILKKFDYILIGVANERHAQWAKAVSDLKIPYSVFSIDHPMFTYSLKNYDCIITAYSPYIPMVEILFNVFFMEKKTAGKFPFILEE